MSRDLRGDEAGDYERLLALYQAERAQREQLEAHVQELQSAQQQLERYATDLQRTHAELRRHLRHMTALHEVSRVISSALDPDEVVRRTVEALAELIVYQVVCIYVLDEREHVAQRAASRGVAGSQPADVVAVGEGPIGQALADASVHLEAAQPRGDAPPALALAIPLRAHGRTLGAIYLERADSDPFAEHELKLMELLAAATAVAMQNALLYRTTRWLATVDPLTEVPNYRYFHETLALEAERARRLRYSLGLLMVDLDRFKRINDLFGHPAGDQVLVAVARAMRAELRRTDVIARVGGEEFAVILPGCGPDAVEAVGEKLRRAVADLPPLAGPGRRRSEITLSVGGAAQGPDEIDPEALLSHADRALYRAKHAGRNRVRVWPEVAVKR
ncbi:MAG: GGDEF domain-containing protein [Chloroflexi bacterium]|nr:GGDEF domain-containing protein [Chloroflexota bacterium]